MEIPKMMKALVCLGPGEYEYKDVPVPEPKEGEILLKTEICGVCAGDTKASHNVARFWGGDGMEAFCKPPFIPGHEFVGRIVAMGENVRGGFKIGDRISTEQITPCGECYYCKRGLWWLCDPHDIYGYKSHLNGGMAEYVLLPKNALNYLVPDDLTSEQVALIEPYACAMHGVRQSQAGVDDVVVLAGSGTLGLGMICELRRRNPRKLIVLDMNESRLEFAKKFGADVVINPSKVNLKETILHLTDGVGCDVYIEATGHPAAVQQGLEIIRKGGRFVEFSVMSGPSTVDWSIIGDTKEITVVGSQLSPYCVEDVIKGISEGWLKTEGVVSHVFDLKDWKEAYSLAESGKAMKVAFKF